MAPTCFAENCNARCHQACNGLSVHQTRYAKNSGRSITWKCLQHGTGIAEITAPPPPVMRFQVVPLLLANPASFVKIRFGLAMLTQLTIAPIHHAIMFVILQPRAVALLFPEGPQEPVFFPLESGTAIYTLHCRQVHIQQHILTPHLHVPHCHH